MSNMDLHVDSVDSGQDIPPVNEEVVVPGLPNMVAVVEEVAHELGGAVFAAEVVVIEALDQPPVSL